MNEKRHPFLGFLGAIIGIICLLLDSCGTTQSVSFDGLAYTIVFPASSAPKTVEVPAQTIVVPASTSPVAMPLVKAPVVVSSSPILVQ